ncbi:major facilitator superfamily domain-containing protein 9-like [Daktulosphaira vitifoliae]|uniref:major facilitator superfamily domain-containing protein 9-like n=1 Tax=Daktulosphaira vitifoliae TaxID=58002 RepID=UPI0021A9FFD6|nr:major facilitator superfamily domain-containing protein 9-like [Daktulosphaira vitifoliae]XP_050541056.1 major facilitator superfamily domain-containing protein 9-like [Daktulosphaira vitifoliae]XP_050541057.1 major facilitator superfamily domain-containing protein 9-like [Daktulosphaira vitifoliae]XP_050541058.1 major facilitator superfamily domain-containing protein 9-like [Daktulosphaira vitifoliae]XP_050541059.1 major facilitator superfamily domain-containing protein 9-like [Daktulosphai
MFDYFYVYMIGFLDIASLGLIMPALGRRLREFGASHFQVSSLESLFSGLQMITSPIAGTLSDRYGRKQMLTLSMIISAMGFFAIGHCYTYISVAIIRLIFGFLKHTLMLGRSLLGDHIPKEHLINAHGKMNSFVSLAFMIAPVIGGRLSEQPNGFFSIACLTSLLCVFNVAIIVLFVPNKKIKTNSIQKGMLNNFKELNWSLYWPLLIMRFMYMATISTIMTTLGLVLTETYKLSPSQVGYVISFNSSIGVVTGFFVSKLATIFKSYSTFNKCFYSFLLLSFGHFCFSFQPNLMYYLLFTIPVSVGGTLIEVFLNQLLSEHCNDNNRGSLEGAMYSFSAIARFITPMTVGVSMDKFGARGAYLFASTAALCGAILAKFYDNKKVIKKIHNS